MKFIVDYDNLVSDWKGARRNDVEYIIDKIVEKVNCEVIDQIVGIEFKLYGGWFSGVKMTKTATDLSVKIQAVFPKVLEVLSVAGKNKKIKVSVELTTGLSYRSGVQIYNTRRKRSVSFLKKSRSPRAMGCSKPDCSLEIVYSTLINGVCSHGGCPAKLDDMVSLEEQKQVDTMMCVDLLELKGSGSTHVGVVSSDDDLYPAVLRLVESGISVLHMGGKDNKNWDFKRIGTTAGKYNFIQI